MTDNEGSVLDTMRERLEEEPDAAILLTLNDIENMESGEQPEPAFSLHADTEDDLVYRYLALIGAKFIGKHYPNEAKAGAAKMAGGSVSFSGAFVDPETELRRRQPDGEEIRTDGGENEAIRSRDVSLPAGEDAAVTVEYSDADGDGFSEEFDLAPGSAMVIGGPDGFMMAYQVPEDAGGGEENDGS